MNMNEYIKFGGNSPLDYSGVEDQLGTRGKLLSELAALKAHISPGFIMSADSLAAVVKMSSERFKDTMSPLISHIENGIERSFGGGDHPLLLKVVENSTLNFVSVTSSTHNIGLNDTTVDNFSSNVGDTFAQHEYANVIQRLLKLKVSITPDKSVKNEIAKIIKLLKNADSQASVSTAIDSARPFFGTHFFSDSYAQLKEVLSIYKKIFSNTPSSQDSSIVIQAMVFGNYRGSSGGFGTMFTRNFITGEKPIFGSYFKGTFNALDVSKKYSLKVMSKKHYATLEELADVMESYFKEIRMVNFTVSNGVLWIIDQRGVAQQTAIVEMKTMLDLYRRSVVDKDYIVKKINVNRVSELLHPTLDLSTVQQSKCETGGLAGAVGAAVGQVYFSTPALMNAYRKAVMHSEQPDYILAMPSTFAEDVKAVEVANGVISSDGGYASHAPVVARSLGKVAMVNPDIVFKNDSMVLGGIKIKEGDYVTMNVPYAAPPAIYLGKGVLVKRNLQESGLLDLISILDTFIDKPVVRANADQPKDAEVSKMFGAQGIGLCRTEHMFFDEKRINLFRAMIIAPDTTQRLKILKRLEKMHVNDFYYLYKIMGKLPVSIRLLDAPLHEFLPNSPKSMEDFIDFYLKQYPETKKSEIRRRCDMLHEFNPMLGHRGVRLAFTYPEIYKMQVRAILKSAYKIRKEGLPSVVPEIMVPLIMLPSELKAIRNGKKIEGRTLDGIADIDAEVRAELNISSPVTYEVGTMIELPSSALSADKIAPYADFFSFGTNDLTQTINGLSRDDFSNFFSDYNEFDLLEFNPFKVLSEPVRELISIAIQRGRLTRPGLKVGLCGEQGAEPENAAFMIEAGLDYISCSPYGIPIAKLALAKYALQHRTK